jgi:hypothetical protein
MMASHGDEHVLVALGEEFVAFDASLLLCNEAPQFVQFDPIRADANHGAVMVLSAADALQCSAAVDRLYSCD